MKTQLRALALVAQVATFAVTGLRAGEIHDAVVAGDLARVKALLETDPTLLESKDDIGETPLVRACRALQVETAVFLMDRGANVHARNRYGASALYRAVQNDDRCLILMRRLLAEGAEVDAPLSANGFTPLFRAVTETDNPNVARFLIEHGADLDARSVHGTVLHTAIAKPEMVKLLLESGARLQPYSYGNTELHLAALNGSAEVVRLLVRHGASVDTVNAYGHSALFYATRHGHRKAAEALIAAGADQGAVAETNYGKARQLDESLGQGEAYLWFLGGVSPGVGYAVKTKEHLLIFNPSGIDDSPEAGLANGLLNPNELAGQKIVVLLVHRSGPSLSALATALPDADFVLNEPPTAESPDRHDIPHHRVAGPNESFTVGGVHVHAIPASRHVFFGGEGFGYLVESDGVKVFHAGLHVSGNDPTERATYRTQIDSLKPFAPVDFVILPVKGRHIDFDYEPYLDCLDSIVPNAVYLIGDDLAGEEHTRCLAVLKTRHVAVSYPEGGIALGERFHYVRQPARARLPSDATTPESGTMPAR